MVAATIKSMPNKLVWAYEGEEQARHGEQCTDVGDAVPSTTTFSRMPWPSALMAETVSQQLPETGVSTGKQLLSLGVSTVCLNTG